VQTHFGRIKNPENVSSGCKCCFIMVSKRVLNRMHNFQAAKENVASHFGGAPACKAWMFHCFMWQPVQWL